MTELYFGVSDNFTVPEFRNRKVIDEIKMVMSAFDCLLRDHTGVYCSSDITTGRQYYDLLWEYAVRSEEELQQRIGYAESEKVVENLKRRNIARGLEFSENVRALVLEKPLVSPGPFEAPGFDQEHYLYLWEWVIIKKIHEVWFNEDWEYSNGCSLEYAIAAKKGISRFDKNGGSLELPCASSKISKAIDDLRSRGFSVSKLHRNLKLIQALAQEVHV